MTPEWLNDLQEANRLFDQKEFDACETLARRLETQAPQAGVPHQLLGLIHVERFEIPEAIAELQRALELRPDLANSHNSLGHCHVLLGNDEQALYHFDRALALEPQHVLAHYNRAVTWLKMGHFQNGWVEHEWRFAAGVAKRQQVARPLWDGSSLENRSLLIYTEQGMGDVLMFARFLPILRRQARRLVVACHHPLQPFLRSLGCIDDWFPIDKPQEINFDVYTALMSIPALLNIEEHSIPRSVPYLYAEPERVEAWRRPVRQLPGFKIGIAWQGNPLFRVDRYRSIPLKHFAALAAIPNVTLIALQHGAGLEQVEPNRSEVPLTFLPELDRDGVFLDRSAVLQHLDLVITSDTSLAHLAGGMGRPVWVALAANCDWRWLRHRSDSPWYPTMRLFRQPKPGDWDSVFREMADALRQTLASRPSLTVPMSQAEVLEHLVTRQTPAVEGTSAFARQEREQLRQLRREGMADSPDFEERRRTLERLHAERRRIEKRLREDLPADEVTELVRALERCQEEWRAVGSQ